MNNVSRKLIPVVGICGNPLFFSARCYNCKNFDKCHDRVYKHLHPEEVKKDGGEGVSSTT